MSLIKRSLPACVEPGPVGPILVEPLQHRGVGDAILHHEAHQTVRVSTHTCPSHRSQPLWNVRMFINLQTKQRYQAREQTDFVIQSTESHHGLRHNLHQLLLAVSLRNQKANAVLDLTLSQSPWALSQKEQRILAPFPAPCLLTIAQAVVPGVGRNLLATLHTKCVFCLGCVN